MFFRYLAVVVVVICLSFIYGVAAVAATDVVYDAPNAVAWLLSVLLSFHCEYGRGSMACQTMLMQRWEVSVKCLAQTLLNNNQGSYIMQFSLRCSNESSLHRSANACEIWQRHPWPGVCFDLHEPFQRLQGLRLIAFKSIRVFNPHRY